MRALPGFKTQPTPQAVVDEHLDALNRGDWDRRMASTFSGGSTRIS